MEHGSLLTQLMIYITGRRKGNRSPLGTQSWHLEIAFGSFGNQKWQWDIFYDLVMIHCHSCRRALKTMIARCDDENPHPETGACPVFNAVEVFAGTSSLVSGCE